MTVIVTLEEVKDWLRVDADHEDDVILLLIDAAHDAVVDYTGAPILTGEVPTRYKLAVLTHVAMAYSNREDGADMPTSVARLLGPMRSLDI
jgi:uncharacterized phage protein (predicted DNA packaging)